MQALLQGDWTLVDEAPPSITSEVSGIVAAYVQWHLERGLRSLPLVDRKN
jgi:DNA repair protein RecO (recombination protein O)